MGSSDHKAFTPCECAVDAGIREVSCCTQSQSAKVPLLPQSQSAKVPYSQCKIGVCKVSTSL